MSNNISPFHFPTLPVDGGIGPAKARADKGFTETLRSAIDEVEQLHADAERHVANVITGQEQDLHDTIIAVEKADLSFQLMMQVRNKIVNAYQEISRMQF